MEILQQVNQVQASTSNLPAEISCYLEIIMPTGHVCFWNEVLLLCYIVLYSWWLTLSPSVAVVRQLRLTSNALQIRVGRTCRKRRDRKKLLNYSPDEHQLNFVADSVQLISLLTGWLVPWFGHLMFRHPVLHCAFCITWWNYHSVVCLPKCSPKEKHHLPHHSLLKSRERLLKKKNLLQQPVSKRSWNDQHKFHRLTACQLIYLPVMLA